MLDLVDYRCALSNEAFTNAMDSLQIYLLIGSYCDESHGGALDGLCDRFGVVEFVLM